MIAALVDAFVDKVNRGPREPQPLAEVPAFLREGEPDECDSHTSWRIVRSDNSRRIESLQHRIARRFPPSFLYFLSTYSFPAFECGPLMFFANTGEDTFWELEKRLFKGPHMSPAAVEGGVHSDREPVLLQLRSGMFRLQSDTTSRPKAALDGISRVPNRDSGSRGGAVPQRDMHR